MTKSDLVKSIAAQMPLLSIKDVKLSVDEVIDTATKALCEGRRVEIRGFGCFTLNYHPPRNARNPQTGEKVVTLATYVPHFKPGKELREEVNAKREPS